MIAPFLRDDALLADLATRGDLRIWWLGQSGFLVRSRGEFILLDPYLSDSLTAKYSGTDKPHVRMTERVIAPERLRDIRFITSSHNHTDHFDPDTLHPLLAANPAAPIVVPAANLGIAAQRLAPGARCALRGVEVGESIALGGFALHAIPAAHEELAPEYCGWVVDCHGMLLYHSGDTIPHPAIVEDLRRFRIDVALLPINGRAPERRVQGNLDGREAAQLAHEIGARWAVPCHYEMFAFNTADPRELFLPECDRLAQARHVLRAGEGWTVPAR